MDFRKPRRNSPRRDYSYLSPERRHYRNRSHSRSPRRRFSPLEQRLSRTSPKQRRSRSRTPPKGFQSKFSKEKDVNGHRRSRSSERKSRIDIEKPQYWGPEDPSILERAMTSSRRIVVVKKTGGYDDEPGAQKQNVSSDRNRTSHDAIISIDRRSTNETRDYSSRRNREAHLLSVDRHSPVQNDHSPRRNSSNAAYESETYKKDYGRHRSDRNEDCDRTERYRKPYDRKNFRRSSDKPYDNGKYRSSRKRDNSKDKRSYDKNDEKKSQRRNKDRRQIDSEHQYQNYKTTEDRVKNEEQIDETKHISEENIEENEGYDSVSNGINGSIVPGMPIRPPLVGPFPRVVPIAPFPLPPFRAPHLLPRFPPPFIPRPFRLPLPRPFPPNRFYPPVPPTY